MFPATNCVFSFMAIVSLHPQQALAKKCALCNRHLIMVAENWGIFFQFNSSKPTSQAEPYGGVMMKALKYMQEELNFTYEIRRSPDKTWGYIDKAGKWHGMVRTIMDDKVIGKIDFCIGTRGIQAKSRIMP